MSVITTEHNMGDLVWIISRPFIHSKKRCESCSRIYSGDYETRISRAEIIEIRACQRSIREIAITYLVKVIGEVDNSTAYLASDNEIFDSYEEAKAAYDRNKQ